MAQIIVIEPNQRLNDLIALQLKQNFNMEVIPRANSDEAMAILSILPEIDLIICRHIIKDEPTGDLIYQYIRKNNLETGLMIIDCKSDKYNNSDTMLVANPEKNWREIIQKTTQHFGIALDWKSKMIEPEYVPIPTRYFLYIETSCCDAYIRIKKTPTEYQFVKRIHKDDKFSKSVIARYIAQGMDNFFIPKNQREFFTNFLSDKLLTKLDNFEDDGEMIELLDNSYKIAHNEILQFGFTSATIQLTEAILSTMVTSIKQSTLMSSLIGKILNSKTSYLYQHSHLTSLIGIEMLEGIGISSHDAHMKIIHASFFSDMTLSDDDELAKIMTYKELEKSILTEEQWDQVFNHCFEASILYNKFPESLLGVSDIIKQHHGSPNGKGYSVDTISKLNGISKIFLVAYDFSKSLLEIKEQGKKIAPIIQEFKEKYNDPEVLKAVMALENILRQKQVNLKK